MRVAALGLVVGLLWSGSLGGVAAADDATFTGWVSSSGPVIRWHTFTVGSVGTIRATLSWDATAADLNLYLQDPLRRTVASARSLSRMPETLTASPTIMGTWWIGVRAASGAASYRLDISYPGEVWLDLGIVDRAADAGIAQVTRSWGTFVHDYDVDGDQDFLYNRHGGSAMLLYANDGTGRFTSVLPGLFPINDRHDCVWGDVNLDGFPDAYCAVGAGHPLYPPKVNELWLGGPDGTLTRAPEAWGAEDPLGRARQPALFDANGDGLLDLFVGNIYPRLDGQPSPNRFFIQDPPGAFRSAPEWGVDLEIGAACAEPADFDEDGSVDLAVCAFPAAGGLKLYRNVAGASFEDVAASQGVTGTWCDVHWADLNADGHMDLLLMSRTLFQIMLREPEGFRTAYRRGMDRAGCNIGGGGDRIATGDVNGDGYPDVYVLYSGYTTDAYNLPDVLLVNDGTGTGFARALLPTTSAGSGQSVAAIEADGDPATEFLVTNGRAKLQGPIQLLDVAGWRRPHPCSRRSWSVPARIRRAGRSSAARGTGRSPRRRSRARRRARSRAPRGARRS